jgi:adenylosuccinate synthase
MPAVVIVGAQWGDEGKGKVVDLYTEAAEVVVRFAGGPNAGHTLVVGDDKVIVRLIPSGILRPKARCILAQGMVIDPAVLVGEIDLLASRGVTITDRVFVSDRAHLIMPYHVLVDGLRESAASAANKIGTTKRGIGPCYEDKAARRGVRAVDLRDPKSCLTLIERAVEAWAPTIRALGGELPSARAIVDELEPIAKRVLPLLADTSRLVDDALRDKKKILFEGAQGTLLDLDHGTYPFVTSSSAVAGGACAGAGVGPTRIDRVIGITKGYITRVGEGPFPTELNDATGERLRKAGGEFGSVTGRPRRTGWLDLPALKYAVRVNGLDGLAITKLDVLTGLPEIQVCVGYQLASGETDDFAIHDLASARPVYRTVPGWTEPLPAVRTIGELPAAARDYVQLIEEATGVPAYVLSVGPRRDETIVLRDAFG